MMAKFRRRSRVIQAEQLTEARQVQMSNGSMHAFPGDWVITTPDGDQYPCSDVVFREYYEPVED